ncbi:hypothetical protein OH77DRAFT_1220333 [Trametes cingulata]|nr:hypothetical protein OH77DRAFT_1220333 [Trametes cingulata]
MSFGCPRARRVDSLYIRRLSLAIFSLLSDPVVVASIMLSSDMTDISITTRLDFPSLARYSASCRGGRRLAQLCLRRDLRRAVSSAIPQWSGFLNALAANEGYIGGLAALGFFLRRSNPDHVPLELFLPVHNFLAFMNYLREVQGLSITAEYDGQPARNIIATVRLQGPTRAVLVHRSSSASALFPILRGANTALTCYVGATDFGVPWPALTFARRALVADQLASALEENTPRLPPPFSVKLYAWMWPEYGLPQTCIRQQFMCPAQPRYLDDAGAVYGVWSDSQGRPRHKICFRLDARPCGGPCLQPHTDLPFDHDRVCLL